MKKRILHGDALAILKTLPAGTFHGCFCDPPYGLSFMGKGWDHGVPPVEVWAEVLRVLKPGAPLLAFGGTRTYHRLACAIEDAGFAISDTLSWLHGQGFPKGKAQLKPAWEPVTLAWKKGARVLAIDAARIGVEPHDRNHRHTPSYSKPGMFGVSGHEENLSHLGRWPANLLLDEESAGLLDAQSGELGKSSGMQRTTSGSWLGSRRKDADKPIGFGDYGGASRFFYCAKASRSERNAGLEGMPEHETGVGALRDGKRRGEPRQNTHPTVKPLKLCEYLARLILPADPDAHLLVPFCGSASEMLGAKRAGWKRITGIEREAEYVGIARRRMTAA